MGKVLKNFTNGWEGAIARAVDDIVISLPNKSGAAIEFGKLGDKAVMIETEFDLDETQELNGYFLLIPTMDSYSKIMTSLGL